MFFRMEGCAVLSEDYERHKQNCSSTKDAPAAIGPYSQAIRVGDTLYTSARLRWNRRLELWSG